MTILLKRFLFSLIFVLTAIAPLTIHAQSSEVMIELGGIGHDMEFDDARQRLYVTVPSFNEVVVISTESFSIVDRIIVGSRPHGIDLSIDGSQLFVALNQAGAVVVLDPDTSDMTEIVVADVLGSSLAHDVVEGKANRVFVSANPGSGGFAWIAMIKLDEGNASVRVANNRIIRANPVFEDSPDHRFLYIGEGFSPNSLYKLDLDQEDAPIVLEDAHGSVSGTDHLEVNPDGSRIYLTFGQVLRTGSFIQAGLVGSGIAQFGDSLDVVFVANEPDLLEVYDTTSFLKVDEMILPCSFNNIEQMVILPGDSGVLVLGDDLVCGLVGEIRVPTFSCVGFDGIGDTTFAVTRPRAIPLRAELLDDGIPVTDADILAPPVLQAVFDSSQPADPPVDGTALALPARQGTTGDQFLFNGEKWEHNLLTLRYSAPGTRTVKMVSGDSDAYIIDPTCEATYVIE
ncbi:MAG: hypothetical protein O7A68_00135 [Alphaproteobacteria bacterium]|nr:hypothetical protein [Alphaproteobacteria bacterium]